MKLLIKLEELLLFVLGIYFFSFLDYQWWWFLVLLLAPDISALGYLFNAKIGAVIYNLFHHRGLAIAIYLGGIYMSEPLVQLTGVVLFSHIAMDRIFGYGLKYNKGFKFTHLGEIGNT